jgi:proliferating cell nuclear antigen
MDIQFKSASTINEIFNGIVDLIPILRMDVKEDGVYVNCLETNGVSFVDLYIAKTDMKKYKVDDETLTIMLDLKFLLKILCKLDKANPVRFVFKSNEDKITITQNKSKYTISLIDIDIKVIPIPTLTNVASVHMSSNVLKDTFDKLSLFSDTCRITSLKTKQALVLSSNGVFGSGREEFKIDGLSVITDTYFDFFPLPYLIKFMKANKVSSEVTLNLVKNKPVAVNFNVFENSHLQFYLAPKVADVSDVSQQDLDEDDDVASDDDEKDEDSDDAIVSDSDSEYENVEVLVSDSDDE